MVDAVSSADLIATANNAIAAASAAITNIDEKITLYLGLITALTIVITVLLQIYLAKDKKRQVIDAVNKIVIEISEDGLMREALIKAILEDVEFKNKFNALIDQSVNDKLDDKLKDMVKEDTINNAVSKKVEETLKRGIGE